MKPLVTLLGLLLVVACGPPDPIGLDAAPSAGPVLHTGSGTVLQAPGEGPALCLGAVAASLPPQCSGVPLVGWDWTEADGEQSLHGTTWGDYTVTGRYDVPTLTVTGQQAARHIAPPADPLTTPCPEPAGGWQVVDARRGSDAAREAAFALAHSAPDHVESWLATAGCRAGALLPRPVGS